MTQMLTNVNKSPHHLGKSNAIIAA